MFGPPIQMVGLQSMDFSVTLYPVLTYECGAGFLSFHVLDMPNLITKRSVDRARIVHSLFEEKESSMRIYVGNLSTDVTDEDLRTEFAAFGQVDSASVIKDRFRDVSRGFAFVEMPVEEEGKAAITALHGKQMKGRSMDVNEARPREQRHSGGRSGGRRGGGGRRSW